MILLTIDGRKRYSMRIRMKNYNGFFLKSSDIESYSFLQLNNCGIQLQTQRETLTTYRKEGRCDYHIVYITEGACEIEYNGKVTLVKHGFVLYPPYVLQRYTERMNTRKLWLHFNGYYVEEILKEAKLSYGVHHTAPSPLCEKLFVQLVTEYNQKADISNEKGLLLTFLCTLGRSIHKADLPTNEKLDAIISFITAHYNAEISIRELADSCDLSQSRFMFLFKEKVGQSPHAYQQMLRLNNSMDLLASTQLNISSICSMSGYNDPLYFSRLFKKYVGMSPNQYRKSQKISAP